MLTCVEAMGAAGLGRVRRVRRGLGQRQVVGRLSLLGTMALVALSAGCGLIGSRSSGQARPLARPSIDPITVTVQDGPRHSIGRVPLGAPVAQVLAAAKILPSNGRLLSAVTRRVLEPIRDPVRFEVDGRPATLQTHVLVPGELVAHDGKDSVEPVVDAEVPVPPTGLPAALQYVHSGAPKGRARVTRGVRSGEVLRTVQLTPPGRSGRVGDKVVSLTFDDGPWPSATPQILAILRAKRVPAVFCLVGRQVQKHPDLVQAERDGGFALCNHTLDHDEHLGTAPAARVEEEVAGGLAAMIAAHTPPPVYYRPPAGSLSKTVYDAAARHGEQVLFWAIDPLDWQRPPAQMIVDRVVSTARPGAIVLLHDGGGDRTNTIAALPLLIDQLRYLGYTFTLPILPVR